MKEIVYELLLGLHDLTFFSSPEKERVIDPFFPKSIGGQYLDQIYNARIRLAKRLKTDIEDYDLMELVEGYESLQKLLSFSMFEYGALLGDKKEAKDRLYILLQEADKPSFSP